MSFFDSFILNIILILFPIISILIFRANIKSVCNANKDILIDIANFSSLFLLIKFCDINNIYMVLLVNMPFIISILYKRRYASLLIAIILVLFYSYAHFNIIFLIGEYFIYLILFVLFFKMRISTSFVLNSFVFIKGIFLTIYEYYILSNNSFVSLVKIFICLTVFYLVAALVINVINMMEKMVCLNQSLNELEKEKNLKNSLFKITHEVKNPIAVCKGYLQMMDYDDKEKVMRYSSIILSELNRTLDIMDNFSQYTKINVNLDVMDLDFLISDTVDSMNDIVNSKFIKINYSTDGDEIFINGDYSRLKQVLINILKNSVEAIDTDGVIDIDLKTLRGNVVLTIKDNGCGISSDELKKIDDLFYSSKEKGCGVGVSLSKEIINLHNGFIKYESKLGSYTKAIITLPLLND